jgi:four helix bundle protein
MQDFKKLRVWHLARRLTIKVLEALPLHATHPVPGLRAQAIRAAASVCANIAEGCGRSTRKDFLQFLHIAIGSLNELEDQLLLALEAKVISVDTYDDLMRTADLVRRMLVGLSRTLQRAIAEEDESDHRRRNEEKQQSPNDNNPRGSD